MTPTNDPTDAERAALRTVIDAWWERNTRYADDHDGDRSVDDLRDTILALLTGLRAYDLRLVREAAEREIRSGPRLKFYALATAMEQEPLLPLPTEDGR